jgi:4-amino-4-deoxy-L-arabinose transferase-like glycosyltransferase
MTTEMSLTSRRLWTLLTVAAALFFCFWRLGSSPVAEWDEARYGANAVEMVRTGDYVNYHYNGALDLWNAKPPLQVWGIVLSSKVFGAGEFSMRFPSAVGILVTLLFLFLIGRDLGGFRLGLLFVWTALLTRALVGYHVGRSGDMDALFIMGLAISDFCLRRVFRDAKRPWYWLGVGLGLAVSFYAKGFALLLVMPGYAILFFKNSWLTYLKSKQFWLGVLTLVGFIGIWFTLVKLYGETDPSKQYEGSNSVAVMIVYDVFVRFTGGLGGVESRDPRILLEFLDTRFGAVYYWLIALGITYGVLRKRGKLNFAQTSLFKTITLRKQEVFYSLVMTLTFLAILGYSKSKLNWYVGPMALWLPCLIWYIVDTFAVSGERLKKVAFATIGLALMINMVHVVRSILAASVPSPIQQLVAEQRDVLKNATILEFPRTLRQDEYLYLLWSTNAKIHEIGGAREFPQAYDLKCEGTACVLSSK